MKANKLPLLTFMFVLLLSAASCTGIRHTEAVSTSTSSDRFFDGAGQKNSYEGKESYVVQNSDDRVLN